MGLLLFGVGSICALIGLDRPCGELAFLTGASGRGPPLQFRRAIRSPSAKADHPPQATGRAHRSSGDLVSDTPVFRQQLVGRSDEALAEECLGELAADPSAAQGFSHDTRGADPPNGSTPSTRWVQEPDEVFGELHEEAGRMIAIFFGAAMVLIAALELGVGNGKEVGGTDPLSSLNFCKCHRRQALQCGRFFSKCSIDLDEAEESACC